MSAACREGVEFSWGGGGPAHLDGVEEHLGHASSLHVDEVRLEQDLWSLKPLSPQLHHPSIRQLQNHTLLTPSILQVKNFNPLLTVHTLTPSIQV